MAAEMYDKQVEDIKRKAVLATVEAMYPHLDAKDRETLIQWAQENGIEKHLHDRR